MKKRVFSRTDAAIIALCLALSVAVLAFSLPERAGGDKGYARVQVKDSLYRVVPLDRDAVIPIDQGNGKINLIAVENGAVRMASSTCDNQTCVHQGSVSLHNRYARALYNTIVCLPNQVLIEVLDEGELRPEERP